YLDKRAKRLKRRKKRKRRKKENKGKKRKRDEAQAAEAVDEVDVEAEDAENAREQLRIISQPSNSLQRATTINDVCRIYSVQKDAHEPLRKMEANPRLMRLRRTQEIRKARAKTKEAGNLKKKIEDYALTRHLAAAAPDSDRPFALDPKTGYCKACRRYHRPSACMAHMNKGKSTIGVLSYQVPCPKSKPKCISVMAYGAAGSGVGSRITGHLRWGGNWIRQELLKLGVV
ncbi:hypothetical protein BGX28_002007, partial [Mortierella sp. GBA30]